MPEDKNKPVEAAKPTDTASVEAAQTAERDRAASLIAACKGHEDIMAKAVKEGWTAEKAELECLRAEKAEAEKAKIRAARPGAPAIVDLSASAPKDAKTVAAAACMGAAMRDSLVEAAFKGVDLDAAHDLKVTRLSDVFAAKVFSPEGIGVNSRTNYPPIWVQGPVDVGSLTIRNLSRDERNIPVPSIRVDKAATIGRLTVRDCKVINRMEKPLAFFDVRGKVSTSTVENNAFISSPGENVQTAPGP